MSEEKNAVTERNAGAEKTAGMEKTVMAEKAADAEKTVMAEKTTDAGKTIAAGKNAMAENNAGEEKTTIAEQLKAGNTVVSFTKGTSMQPLLHEGKTYVVVAPIAGGLSVGDLPLWQRGDGKYVLHRLIKMEGGFCYTRGDNCIGTEKTPKEKMLGVVTEIGRGEKTIRVTDRDYRLYVLLWLWLSPVRIPLYRLRAKAGRLRRRLRERLGRG